MRARGEGATTTEVSSTDVEAATATKAAATGAATTNTATATAEATGAARRCDIGCKQCKCCSRKQGDPDFAQHD
jgi:hypothetical protein